MSIQFRPVGLPGPEYSPEEESQFRRSLETYLLDISSVVNDAESSTNGLASSASKRESLIPAPSSVRFPFNPSAIGESPVALIDSNSIHYTGNPVLRIPDTVSSLDYIYGGSEGAKLTLVKVGSTNTVTVRESGTGNGSIKLVSTTAWLREDTDIITFVCTDGVWIELSKSISGQFSNRTSASVLDFGALELYGPVGLVLSDQSVKIQAAIDFCQLHHLVLEFPVRSIFVCNNTLNIFMGAPITFSSVVTGLLGGFNPTVDSALNFSGGGSGTVYSWDSTTSTLVWRNDIGSSAPSAAETVTSSTGTATLGTVVDDLVARFQYDQKNMIIHGNGSTLRPFVDINGPVLNVVGYNSVAQMEDRGPNGSANGFFIIDDLTVDLANASSFPNVYAAQFGSSEGILKPTRFCRVNGFKVQNRAAGVFSKNAIEIELARLLVFENCQVSPSGGVSLLNESTLAGGFTGDMWFNRCDFRSLFSGTEGDESPDRAVQLLANGTIYSAGVNTSNIEAVHFSSCQFYGSQSVLLKAQETAAIRNVTLQNCGFDNTPMVNSNVLTIVTQAGSATASDYQPFIERIKVINCNVQVIVPVSSQSPVFLFMGFAARSGYTRNGGVWSCLVEGCFFTNASGGTITTGSLGVISAVDQVHSLVVVNSTFTDMRSGSYVVEGGGTFNLIVTGNSLNSVDMASPSITAGVYADLAVAKYVVVTGNIFEGNTAASLSAGAGSSAVANNV
tara:strand:+ start:10792 stop:12984 length:2193 start_codon:yes stop_codon:yes gene_type:complete